MSICYRMRNMVVTGALLGVFLSACGGGGGGTTGTTSSPPPPSPSFPSKILSWHPPTSYTDNTALDPATELDAFEVHVNTSGFFSDADMAVAYVRAVDPGTGQVTTQFDLAKLGPFLSWGVPYQVSLRAVALTGAKSDFAPAASFSF